MIYTAHWDHLGIGLPDANGDRIYNGAVDNATGIAHLIEQARAFARGAADRALDRLPRRRRRGEGPARQRILCRQPALPARQDRRRDQHRRDGRVRARPATSASRGTAKLGLLDRPDRRRAEQGRSFTPDPHPEAGGFYRSDHFPFAKVGVPAIASRRGNDLVNGGVARGEALSEDYTDQALPPARRRIFARLGLQRHGRGCRVAPRGRPRPRQFAANGRTGAKTASSAPCATRAPPSAAGRRHAASATPGERG